MASSKKMRVVFVLGPPGSGKGTQCAKIEKEFKFVHLSAGDLLRAERQREGSEYGELIEHHITNGTIVPVEITCKLLENAMYAAGGTRCPGFLIDGFPRNRDNLEGWKRNMDDKAEVAFVLFIQCDIDICVKRCLSRGATSGRSDDNETSMRKRVETYYNQTMPIIDQYAERCLVRTVDGGKGNVDEVFEAVKEVFHEECKDTVKTPTAPVQA